MRILLAITAACVLILLWVAYAIWRHIVAGVHDSREDQPAAGRSPLNDFEAELKQQLRSAHSAAGFFRSAPAAEPVAKPEPAADSYRKPPVSISGSTMNRLDWSHFTSDLGDLSDPYQMPRRTGSARQNHN